MEISAKKIVKKPEEPYQEALTFPETGEISLFESNHCKVFVLIVLNYWRMRPITCVYETGAGLNLVRADILDLNWLDSVRSRDMSEIRSASSTKRTLSGSITLHPRVDE